MSRRGETVGRMRSGDRVAGDQFGSGRDGLVRVETRTRTRGRERERGRVRVSKGEGRGTSWDVWRDGTGPASDAVCIRVCDAGMRDARGRGRVSAGQTLDRAVWASSSSVDSSFAGQTPVDVHVEAEVG